MSRLREPNRTEAADEVAAYTSVDGASMAATHLVELGFDEESVKIAPRGFHVERDHPVRRTMARGLKLGAVIGAVAAGVIWLLSATSIEDVAGRMLPAVLTGAGIGVLAGALLAAAAAWQERRRSFGPPAEQLVPARYEVVVAGPTDRANHQLARWWNPAAQPTRPGRST